MLVCVCAVNSLLALMPPAVGNDNNRYTKQTMRQTIFFLHSNVY